MYMRLTLTKFIKNYNFSFLKVYRGQHGHPSVNPSIRIGCGQKGWIRVPDMQIKGYCKYSIYRKDWQDWRGKKETIAGLLKGAQGTIAGRVKSVRKNRGLDDGRSPPHRGGASTKRASYAKQGSSSQRRRWLTRWLPSTCSVCRWTQSGTAEWG